MSEFVTVIGWGEVEAQRRKREGEVQEKRRKREGLYILVKFVLMKVDVFDKKAGLF